MDIDAGPERSSSAAQSNGQPGGHAPLVVAVTAALAVPATAVAILLCWAIPAVPWWVGLIIGVVAAAGAVGSRLRNTAASQLRALRAEPADPNVYARFHNIVQGLSLAGGIPEPKLYVIDDDARNVACIADSSQSAVVATTGLLTGLDRIGLEGVMAGAVVRIRSGDAAAGTLAAALFGPLRTGPAAKAIEPVVALGLRRLLPNDRDLVADRATVRLTRYPPGLLGALTAIRSGPVQPARAGVATDHLWLVPLASTAHKPGGPVPPSALDLRIDILAEL